MMKRVLIAAVLVFVFVRLTVAQTHIGFSIGGDSADVAQNFCMDAGGNIIIVGSFSSIMDFNPGASVFNLTSNGSTDNYISKYNPDGDFLWAVRIGGTGPDVVNGVTTDAQGNIYVCGAFASQCDFDAGSGSDIHTPEGMTDAYIVKYSSSGTFVWANTFGGDSLETLYDIVHSGGAVYAIGSYQDTFSVRAGDPSTKVISRGGKDLILVSYDDDGALEWVSTWGDVDDDEGTGITANPAGTLYIGGYATRSELEPPHSIAEINSGKNTGDILFGARTSAGELLWNVRIGGEGFDQVSPGGISLDSNGDVYITGWFSDSVDFNPSAETAYRSSNGYFDVFAAKYTSTGKYISSMSFGGLSNDQAFGVGVDWQGNIFLTGCFRGAVDFDPGEGVRTLTSAGTNGAGDFFTAMYSPTGILFWANRYGPPASGSENSSCSYAVATDTLNNCYITGKFFGSCDVDPSSDSLWLQGSGNSDAFLIKYNHNGQIWKNSPGVDINSRIADFGDVLINTQSIVIREIYNSGDGILYVSSITSTSQRFGVLESPAYILPGKSFQLAMVFSPRTLGLQSGYIVIEHNAPNQSDTIFVSGNGDGRAVSLTLPLMSGWNMVSLPAQIEDGSTETLFPEAISDAFAFYDGSYATRDTFHMTVGYWLKFEDPVNILIEGAARDSATIQVRQGWNMIGAISSVVNVDSIEQQPPGIIGSSFFTYDGTYYESQTLDPGGSYWVKINSAGRIFLRGSELIRGKTMIKQ